MKAALPLKLISEANTRQHWATKAARVRKQRQLAHRALRVPLANVALPVVVTITRIGKRSLDGDNLQGSAKAVRDGIADALGIDDADPRVTWEYAQRKGDYAVEIEVVSAR